MYEAILFRLFVDRRSVTYLAGRRFVEFRRVSVLITA